MTIKEKISQLPDLLKVSEVSDLLRVSQPTVKRWIREGDIKGMRFSDGGEYRIEKEEISKKIDS